MTTNHLEKPFCLQLAQNGSLLACMLQDEGPHMVCSWELPQPVLQQLLALCRDELPRVFNAIPCLRRCHRIFAAHNCVS